jgi:hypothetical protein
MIALQFVGGELVIGSQRPKLTVSRTPQAAVFPEQFYWGKLYVAFPDSNG